MKKEKKINLKVNVNNSGHIGGSSFVVDLKKGLEEINESRKNKIIDKFWNKFTKKLKTKKKNIFYKKETIKKEAQKIKTKNKLISLTKCVYSIQDIKRRLEILKIKVINIFKKDCVSFVKKNNSSFQSLIVVSFFNILLKFLLKSGYLVGWFFLFLVRFIFLFTKLILRHSGVFFSKFNLIKFRFRASNKKIHKNKNIFSKAKGFLNQPIIFRKKEFAKIEKIISFIKVVNIKNKIRIIKKKHKIKPKKNLFSVLKGVLIFSAILFVLILPFKLLTFYTELDIESKKNNIIKISKIGVDNFFEAANASRSLNFQDVGDNLGNASDSFLNAQRELDDVNGFLFTLASLIPSKNMQLASVSRNVLAAGQISADIALNLNKAVENLLDNQKNKNIYHALENFNKYAHKALLETRILKAHLEKINLESLPVEYQEKFKTAQEKMILMESSLEEFLNISKGLYDFLGMSDDKRYLLVFQNNSEARATGGFVGSYALIDFRNGKVRNLEVPEGGSYDTDGGLKVLIKAPEPLRLVSPLWYFRDSNWWPDWPTSARKMMWFYENSDGPSVDGVVTFTPTFFESLLKIIGPVELPEYKLTITSDNFWDIVQDIVEKQPYKNNPRYLISDANKPKKIIGDLARVVLEVLPERLDQEKLVSLVSKVNDALEAKQVLFYFKENDLQEKVNKYGWSGSVKPALWDYLSIINTNIAGQKTDKVINQEINHKAEVLKDGTIINTLIISRIHNGKKGDSFTGVRNVNWMRVYVPQGSFLIEASGFEEPDEIYFEEPKENWVNDRDLENERNATVHKSKTKIYKEFGKTVFANWTMIDPGESKKVILKYQLPFKINPGNKKTKETLELALDVIKDKLNIDKSKLVPYALMVQKQAGFKDGIINSTLVVSGDKKIIWRYPEGLNTSPSGWDIKESLNKDKYWAVLIE